MIAVLIAEDHPIMRQGIEIVLERDPDVNVVGVAADGLEAVRLSLELRPDVVLMDLDLPYLGGIEAIRRLKQPRGGPRVLVLSQSESPQDLESALQAGAQGYLTKQAAFAELLQAVHTVAQGQIYLGASMTTLLVHHHLQPASVPDPRLTSRESQVLGFIVDGMSTRGIAEHLRLSVKTVQSHRTSLMQKLDIHDRVELVKYAICQGLVEAGPDSAQIHRYLTR